MAHEFISYELPTGYSEKMGMDFLVYKMIVIGQGDDDKNTQHPTHDFAGTFSTDPGNDS